MRQLRIVFGRGIVSGPLARLQSFPKPPPPTPYEGREEVEGKGRTQAGAMMKKRCLLLVVVILGLILGTEAGGEAAAARPTLMATLQKSSQPQGWHLVPLVLSQGGEHRSVFPGPPGPSRAEADRLKAGLQDFRAFWLYHQGRLVGTFKVKGWVDLSPGPFLAWEGEVDWRINLAEEDLPQVVALSRPIPQPFWLADYRLTQVQTSGLNRLLEETLRRAPQVIEAHWKAGPEGPQVRPEVYAGQQTVGPRPGKTTLVALEPELDGAVMVYARVDWKGKPCKGMTANVLAVWRNKWVVLRVATQMSECPHAPALGERVFEVLPVDLDGDGVAELIITERFLDAWTKVLYQYREGQLHRLLTLARGGR